MSRKDTHRYKLNRTRRAESAPDAAPQAVSYRWPALVAALIAGLIYLRTLSPGMQMGDGTELATAAAVMGVPHPTGYPLYMILGKLWLLLTIGGDAIVKLSLLNAIFMAGAVALTTLIAGAIVDAVAPASTAKIRTLLAVCAGLVTAFLRYHWKNAVVTEVYALEFLLMAGFSYLLLRAGTGRITRGLLVWSAVIFAAGIAHHRLTVVLAIPFAWLWFKAFQRVKRSATGAPDRLPWVSGVLILLAGCALYAWLPFRAAQHPPVNWGDPVTLHRFLDHVQGKEYLSQSLMRPGLESSYGSALLTRFVEGQSADIVMSFAAQFTPVQISYQSVPGMNRALMVPHAAGVVLFLLLLIPLAAGAWRLFRLVPFWLLACGLIAAQNLLVTYLYNIADIADYYLYPFWFGWMLIFTALAALVARRDERSGLVWAYGALALPLLVLAGNWNTDNHSTDTAGEILSAAILPESKEMMPEHSILITGSDADTFTTWYRQFVRHERDDVLCFAGNFIWMPWYRSFFRDDEIRRYHMKFADGVAVGADQFARQISDGIIQANVGSTPIFTSIQDHATIRELMKLYQLTPVNAAELSVDDSASTVVLFKISVKDDKTTQ